MKEVVSWSTKNKQEELTPVTFPTKEEYLAKLEVQNKHELIPAYEKVLTIADRIKELGDRKSVV